MVCMILVPFWSPTVDHQSRSSDRSWRQTDPHPAVILACHCGVGTRGHQAAAGARMGAIRHPRTERRETKSHSSRHTSHMNLTSCSRNPGMLSCSSRSGINTWIFEIARPMRAEACQVGDCYRHIQRAHRDDGFDGAPPAGKARLPTESGGESG